MRAAIVGLVVAALAVPACVRASGSGEARPLTEAILVVDNQRFQDMTMYVVKAGGRLRIGVARGNGKTQFSLRPDILGDGGELQFIADPIGGDAMPISESLRVNPGDVVEMVIR
jgi:hypothetical protein